MQSASAPSHRPHWLRVLVIGRRPKATLIRIAVLVIVCIVTFGFVLVPIRIEGISMEPTYHDRRVNCVNRLAYWRTEPQRGDVVSIRFSKSTGLIKSPMLMKRIVALPGETVFFRDGRAYINGERLDEPYLKFPCDWQSKPVQCGPDEYFVVGDNRSMPMLYHQHGRVRRDHIVGKVLL